MADRQGTWMASESHPCGKKEGNGFSHGASRNAHSLADRFEFC